MCACARAWCLGEAALPKGCTASGFSTAWTSSFHQSWSRLVAKVYPFLLSLKTPTPPPVSSCRSVSRQGSRCRFFLVSLLHPLYATRWTTANARSLSHADARGFRQRSMRQGAEESRGWGASTRHRLWISSGGEPRAQHGSISPSPRPNLPPLSPSRALLMLFPLPRPHHKNRWTAQLAAAADSRLRVRLTRLQHMHRRAQPPPTTWATAKRWIRTRSAAWCAGQFR